MKHAVKTGPFAQLLRGKWGKTVKGFDQVLLYQTARKTDEKGRQVRFTLRKQVLLLLRRRRLIGVARQHGAQR